MNPPCGGLKAEPFLKWAGGKRKLIPELHRVIYEELRWDSGVYREPFVGGGALFFHLAPRVATLSDSSEELITAYKVVRDYPTNLIDTLALGLNDEGFFKQMRARTPVDEIDAAARMIYLNRTCFNGLYRVNKKGEFNVPFGHYKNPTICNAENIRACSGALKNQVIFCTDFCNLGADPGDLLYCDPPYLPISETSDFSSYTSAGFRAADHARLRDWALLQKQRGVKVLISNSNAPLVRELYAGWNVREVLARRNINSKRDGRGEITELLIW